MHLTIFPARLAVCRLAPDAPLPDWAIRAPFFSVTRTPDELSVVTTDANIPADITAERNWQALRVVGPLDFALTGILASLAVPLAEAKIPIFALSTYDTDYLLVKAAQLGDTVLALTAAGHTIGSVL